MANVASPGIPAISNFNEKEKKGMDYRLAMPATIPAMQSLSVKQPFLITHILLAIPIPVPPVLGEGKGCFTNHHYVLDVYDHRK